MAFDAARLMLSAGLISESDLGRAMQLQAQRGGALPRACHELGVLDESRWARVVARALSLPTVDVSQLEVDPAARGIAPDTLLRPLYAFPFQLRDGGRTLVLAMAEPQDDVARAQLRAASGCELRIGVAGYHAIEAALEKNPNPNSPSGVGTFLAGGREGDLQFDGTELGGATEEGDLEPDFVDADLVEPEEEVTDLTPEEERLVQALEQNTAQSTKALQAALQLVLGRKIFTAQELADRMNRKK